MYKHTLNKRVSIFNVSRILKRNYFDETNPIPIILHPSWLGQKHIGVSLSPYLIKNEFQKKQYLDNYFKSNTLQYRCPQINFMNSGAKNEDLIEDLENLYKVNASIDTPRINIGGDHSMSISTLAYTLNNYPDAKVLWFDAHPDLNTYEKSDTKNVHGMPLSFLSQLDKHYAHNFSFINNPLCLHNLLYVGIRSIDEYEKEIIEKYNISYIPSNIVNKHTEETVCIIKNFINNSPFHLSIDVDVLSSDIMPCTGTPVDEGIRFLQLKNIVNKISAIQNLVNVDIVELNIINGDHNIITRNDCLEKTTLLLQNILKNMAKL
jgi:arginase